MPSDPGKVYCNSAAGSRPDGRRSWRQLAALVLLLPVTAQAEPSVGTGHIPPLIALIIVLSALPAFVVIRWGHHIDTLRTPARRWLVGLILSALFLVLAGPFIYIIGAIAITGRTM